ncbi:LptE family protein [Compostibacter hankyongensis]|uniref:LptE family protein n=1 Tax=Compostibacter hankyongensis TaxID=1007089 RepID=A0ABP8FVM7_9BACT
MKINPRLFYTGPAIFLAGILMLLSSCGIYSFNGASIDPAAKTVNVHFIENKAPYNNPTLSQKLTEGLRTKITSQSRLAQVNSDEADYIFSGAITGYAVSNAAVTNVEQAATSRLTITVNIDFKSKLNPKANFSQSFSRSADFPASRSVTEVQDNLVTDINKQLVDDIFNKAFVNW